MEDEIAFLGARELARRLRAGEFSSLELLEFYLGRIERLNGPLNAVVTLDPDGVREKARRADARLERGERAGAIVFGKTNVPLFSGDVQTFNEIFGVTNNPWNVERTPGGSSGGAAASVACGFTAFEIGSDIGGSIRTPANWNGIYGHKSSWGLVPARGHIPGPPGALAETDLGVFGPLARTAEDLELLLDIIAGPDEYVGAAWSFSLPPARRSKIVPALPLPAR